MKQIKFYGADAEECIGELKKFSERLKKELELLKNIMNEISPDDARYDKLSDIRKTLERQSERADECVHRFQKTADIYEAADDRVRVMIRKKIFSTDRKIIVEKSKEAVKSSMIGGRTLIHDESLGRLVLKEMAGNRK